MTKKMWMNDAEGEGHPYHIKVHPVAEAIANENGLYICKWCGGIYKFPAWFYRHTRKTGHWKVKA